jgi:hypothetical protein
MPTVDRFDGFRVVIYHNDHEPVHVHVIGGSGTAIFNLDCKTGSAELREKHGLNRGDIQRIRGKLEERVKRLCEEWDKIHGEPR